LPFRLRGNQDDDSRCTPQVGLVSRYFAVNIRALSFRPSAYLAVIELHLKKSFVDVAGENDDQRECTHREGGANLDGISPPGIVFSCDRNTRANSPLR